MFSLPAELTDATGTSVLSSHLGSVRATAGAVSSMMLGITLTVCSWSKVPNVFFGKTLGYPFSGFRMESAAIT